MTYRRYVNIQCSSDVYFHQSDVTGKSKAQAINYSVTREKAPIYTMGSADCRSYSRNKRGIAGGLI